VTEVPNQSCRSVRVKSSQIVRIVEVDVWLHGRNVSFQQPFPYHLFSVLFRGFAEQMSSMSKEEVIFGQRLMRFTTWTYDVHDVDLRGSRREDKQYR